MKKFINSKLDTSTKMKTPHSTLYRYSGEAIAHANKLPLGTVAEREHKAGMLNGEPLLVAMDCLLKYAEAYRHCFERNLSEDYVLGLEWLSAASGIRGLLNGYGALALIQERTTDSKDNGCIESLFWDALAIAGFTEADLDKLP